MSTSRPTGSGDQRGKAGKAAPDEAVAARASEGTPATLRRDFLALPVQPPVTVVVDLGTTTQVASAQAGESPLERLRKIAGTDALPVFDRRRGRDGAMVATLADNLPRAGGFDAGRFVEFVVGDAATAADLATEIKKDKVGGSMEALPVPPAVPALGPARFEAAGEQRFTEVPSFFNYQGYLADGPAGLGFIGAWAYPGGDGSGVTVIDVEGGWRTEHVELSRVRFSLWSGRNTETEAWQEHGCAVISLLAASHDGHGTASVCPGVRAGMVSVFEGADGRQRIANQIASAGELLAPGDVLLLELQRPGPRTSYAADPDQKGYVPLIFWPDVRAVVRDLTDRGVTVVSVAGNGGENLDDEIYAGRFDLARNDSGCILVGAGAPPTGGFGAARTRLEFSNHGAALDVQAWGNLVVAAGYGDLWGSSGAPEQRYTDRFMGTSSAAPLVAGVVACIQGRHKAVYGVPVNPLYLRHVMRRIGWGPTEQGGQGGSSSFVVQPDLRQLFAALDIA